MEKKQLYILSCAFLKKGVKITFGEGFYTKVVLEAIMVQWVSKDFFSEAKSRSDLSQSAHMG